MHRAVMLRRSFVISSSALGLAACGGREHDSAAPIPEFALFVVDDETTFRDTGLPYLHALSQARMFEGTQVEPVITPSYGRPGGVLVTSPVVAVADDEHRLNRFFAELPNPWQLPLSQRIAVSHQSWVDPNETPRWGARVVWARPVVDTSHIVSVRGDADGVEILLDRRGADAFESASAANVGRRLAIEIDGEVVADPIVNEPIVGGRIRVTLSGGQDAHETLARLFMP
jgi:hypothetical protein